VPDWICEIESNIDDKVIERTDTINEDTLLHDEDTEEITEEVKEFLEQNHLSELDRRVANMDKREMITVCCVAIRKYPLAYIQVIAEYIMELTRKGRKR
jgi:acetyl-CoA carboxylase alpha subunit